MKKRIRSYEMGKIVREVEKLWRAGKSTDEIAQHVGVLRRDVLEILKELGL